MRNSFGACCDALEASDWMSRFLPMLRYASPNLECLGSGLGSTVEHQARMQIGTKRSLNETRGD